MSIIEGSSVSCRTLADGTLRLAIDIEPAMAQAAFTLFGAPGRAVVVAALKDGRDAKSALEPVVPAEEAGVVSVTTERPHLRTATQAGAWDSLGPMTKAAISIAAAPEFWQWCGATNSLEAGAWIKKSCGIDSRKELDLDGAKGAFFRAMVLQPYQKHMATRRGE